MDTSKIDQLRDQSWELHRKFLQANVDWSEAKLAYHAALQEAGYQLVLCLNDRYLVWCHPDYIEIIKESVEDGSYKDLPSYAMYIYMA